MKQLLSLIVLLMLSTNISLGQSDYSQKWNQPTISHKSINPYFGKIGVFERNTTSDKIEIPAIPGLKYRSCMVVCPIDSCFGQRALIALRCPDNSVLLDAISGRLCDYSNKITHSAAIQKCEKPESSATVRSYYIDAIRSYINKHTEHTEGQILPNEQHGILISDCWQSGDYCTFYEAMWFDMDSNGNQTTESYFTIDSKTGKVLRVDNIVAENGMGLIAELLPKYLISESGKHYEGNLPEPWNLSKQELLSKMEGCALIREGLVIFYHPMVIDAALSGGYKAVIPYREIQDYLLIKETPSN